MLIKIPGLLVASAVATAASFAPSSASAETFYRLESAVALKSTKPDWDYLAFDAARGNLFIARRGEGVVVYSAKTKKAVKTIDQSDDAGAIVLVPEFDRGYSANEDGTSTVFQMSTLKTIERLKFGNDADSGVYDPVTKQIAFTMADSSALAFVDAKSGKLVGQMAVDSKKLDGMVADGEGNVLMALRDRNAVVKVDVAGRKVVAEWKTAPCEQPTGMAYDKVTRRAFVGCRGKAPVLTVIDAVAGTVVATLDIGRGNDGVVFDPSTKKVITSNGVDGNLVIYDQVDADHYKLAEATTTRPYARTMAYDYTTHKIYLVTAEGTADPSKKINTGVTTFYPNRYFTDTFTVLTMAPR
jgi:DNA-binding beta-propeller fold protein YncE